MDAITAGRDVTRYLTTVKATGAAVCANESAYMAPTRPSQSGNEHDYVGLINEARDQMEPLSD